MQEIEPTGVTRIEWYLARMIAAIKGQWSDRPIDWRKELIGWEPEPEEQSMEQALAAFESFEKQWQ